MTTVELLRGKAALLRRRAINLAPIEGDTHDPALQAEMFAAADRVETNAAELAAQLRQIKEIPCSSQPSAPQSDEPSLFSTAPPK